MMQKRNVSKVNVPGQLRAKTSAKQARIKESGLTSRRLGAISARGKRNQARRDSKQ
ncbi:hypothetical protein BH09PLA1_BH09PLA1_10300 [soil metagenome]